MDSLFGAVSIASYYSRKGMNRSVFLFASLRPIAPRNTRSRDVIPLLARFISSAKHRHSLFLPLFPPPYLAKLFYNSAL